MQQALKGNSYNFPNVRRSARVYLLGHGAIPLTDSGKVQYGRLREQYLSGKLRSSAYILFPDYQLQSRMVRRE